MIDCLERPRKKGAKWTNSNIAADEFLAGEKAPDWDSKRDRWDGYDPAEHKKVVEEHQALESARQKMREEQLDKSTDLKEVKKVARAGKVIKKKTAEEDEFGSSDESDDEDEDKYADAADQAGQKMDAKTRMTVRNLRIREDTAKYLMNLDVDSAYYDPKTRSMREAPQADVAPEDVSVSFCLPIFFDSINQLETEPPSIYSTPRPSSPVITFNALQLERPTFKSSNYSPGNLNKEETMFISMPIRLKENSCIKNI